MSKRQQQDDSKAPKVTKGKGARSWSPKAGKNRTAEGKHISPAKQRRIDAQREREEHNADLRRSGLPTAWEQRRDERRARRAAMALPKQERINGLIVKKDSNGSITLVSCCKRCDREAEVAAARAREQAQAAGARKVRANDKRQKAASAAKKIMPPKQIHPKEN